MADQFDHSYDLVIIGSGAGSMPAALVARQAGKTALIVEKSDLLGGSTTMSGGVAWIPMNPVMERAGVKDSLAEATAYLDAVTGPITKGSSKARRESFLREGPKVVGYLESHGMKFFYPKGYSDYYEGELPGGVASGRSIVGEVYDARGLGPFAKRIRRQPPGTPPFHMGEANTLTLFGRTLASKLMMLKVGVRLMRNKLGADLVGMGTALYGRMLELAVKAGTTIWTSSPVEGLIERDGRVVGVSVRRDGRIETVEARQAVLIDAGGFAHNLEMRKTYQNDPVSVDWTFSNPGDTGEVMQMAMKIGAAVEAMQRSFWVAGSMIPDEPLGMHPADLQKPHSIMVDMSGQRFLNEATDYVAVGNTMYERHKTVPAVPCWAIIESRHRNRYGWGGRPPGPPPAKWLETGFIKQADTLEDLARQCELDPAQLKATVERFNGFARKGVDDDFGRGHSAWNRYFADPTSKPNASLGTIEKPPFYAIKVYPGDVGTSGGLVADEYGRVLREDDTPIQGLYATGNVTASVMGQGYPGAGASIAPSLVFGYIAARHAFGRN